MKYCDEIMPYGYGVSIYGEDTDGNKVKDKS